MLRYLAFYHNIYDKYINLILMFLTIIIMICMTFIINKRVFIIIYTYVLRVLSYSFLTLIN